MLRPLTGFLPTSGGLNFCVRGRRPRVLTHRGPLYGYTASINKHSSSFCSRCCCCPPFFLLCFFCCFSTSSFFFSFMSSSTKKKIIKKIVPPTCFFFFFFLFSGNCLKATFPPSFPESKREVEWWPFAWLTGPGLVTERPGPFLSARPPAVCAVTGRAPLAGCRGRSQRLQPLHTPCFRLDYEGGGGGGGN